MKSTTKIFILLCLIAFSGCDKKSLTVDFQIPKPIPPPLPPDYSGNYSVVVTQKSVVNIYQGQGNYIGSTVTYTNYPDTLTIVNSNCSNCGVKQQKLNFTLKNTTGIGGTYLFNDGKYDSYRDYNYNSYNGSYIKGSLIMDSVFFENYWDSHTSSLKTSFKGKKIN